MSQHAWHFSLALAMVGATIVTVRSSGDASTLAVGIAFPVLWLVYFTRVRTLEANSGNALTAYDLARDREAVLKWAAANLILAPDRAAIGAITRQAALALGHGFPGLSAHVDLLDEPSMACSPAAIPPVSGGWMAPDLVLTVPLTTKSTVYGMIVASGTIPLPVELSEALETLASQVTLALHAAALTEDLDRQRSESRVTALIQNSSDVVMVLDSEFAIRYSTPSVTRVLGHYLGSLLGRSLADIVHPDDQAKVAGLRSRDGGGVGSTIRTEWRMRRGDGRWVEVESISNDLLDHPGVNGLVVTTRDISERKNFEHSLENQVDKLKELDRIKDEFVATVSHELRTPIASVIGQSEMLLDGDFGSLDPTQKRAVSVIDRNSHRLLLLIEDLLALNQIESGGLQLNPKPTDFGALLERAVHDIDSTARARPVRVVLGLHAALGSAVVDAAQIERALANLLTNAVKFSPEGGQVHIGAQRDRGWMVVTVSDEGIGIPEEEQEGLFTRFFRSSLAVSMAIQGTGLGLVIVKRIVEEHGGTISVDSALGKGTVVRVAIPLKPAPMSIAV